MNRKTLKGFTEPMRTCVGCRASRPKKDMIRVCFYEGKLSVDPTGRAKGRGVYVCADPDCLDKVKKRKALNRGFRTGFDEEELAAVYDELDKVISERRERSVESRDLTEKDGSDAQQ